MSQAAESLANEILEGTYTPTVLDTCTSQLVVDRNPQVVRMVQILLFRDPRLDVRSTREPRYLVFQQAQPTRKPEGRHRIIDAMVKPLAAHLTANVADASPDLAGDPLSDGHVADDEDRAPVREPAHDRERLELPPANDGRIDIDRIRAAAREHRIPGYDPQLAEKEVRRLYGDWRLRDGFARLQSTLEPFLKAGFIEEQDLVRDRDAGPGWLESVLTTIFVPHPYQPFRNPHPHVALCAVYEQVWEPKGYTRGELINTISLAPGEQLTLEVHSWDKSVMRSEEQMAIDSEMRSTERSTQRDAHTVARETATRVDGHLDASATIPIKGIPVKLDGGVSGEVRTNLKETLEQTRERMVEAVNTLKTTRKLRIEASREVGRERKQTRTIANTNRCHSVNFHYFEVMSNYLVTTRLVELQPCLLLPNPDVKITSAWVLCHEGALKQVLLDGSYLPGFDGARVVETHEEFLQLKKEEAKARGEVANPVQQALQGHVDSICDAYDRLRGSVRKVRNHARSWECKAAAVAGGTLGLAVCVAAKSGLTRLRRVLYLAMLHANEPAVNGLKKLKEAKGAANAVHPLQGFFACVSPRDFQFNPASAAIAKGLDAIGIPGKLVDGLMSWGLLDHIADDAGLYNAVQGAASALETAWDVPPEAAVASKEGYATMDVARATTAFEQLKCHLEDNWLHYAQAIWRSENSDSRFERLQHYGSVSAMLENRILGFLGRKAAYRLTDPAAIKDVDFANLIDEALRAQGDDAPAPLLVTLPTQGTLLEAMLGQCDSCDDFIQQSRVIDLRTQEAKARSDEAQARRLAMRLDAGDLSDPSPALAGKVTVGVDPGAPNP